MELVWPRLDGGPEVHPEACKACGQEGIATKILSTVQHKGKAKGRI